MWHVWVRVVVRTGFLVGKPEGKSSLENIDVDGRIILKVILKKSVVWWGLDWIDVGQERERWRAVVNTVMSEFGENQPHSVHY
jgi:hypothetical protein